MIDEAPDAEKDRDAETRKNEDGEIANLLPVNISSASLPLSASPRRRLSPQSILALAVFALVVITEIGIIVYQNYLKEYLKKELRVSNPVLFTGAKGNENFPAFSPDGKLLAYSWNGGKGSESDIYVKRIGAAGEPLQLTGTKANEQYPVFSPDGKYIAFVRGKDGEPGDVMIIPSLGGTERRIATLFSGDHSISFSPDGKYIAVADTENASPGGQAAIYLIDTQTGERRRLTDPTKLDSESAPRFSPDGESLVFIRSTSNKDLPGIKKHNLFVVSATGKDKPRQLTLDDLMISSPAWSADGEYIYFVPHSSSSQTFIKRVPAQGFKQEKFPLSGNNATNIALSPDGKRLAYVENNAPFSIRRASDDGQPMKILNKANINQASPHFSPDGSRIAFHSDRTGTFQIWTMDADGQNMQQITNSTSPSTSPHFSPDHLLIAYTKYNSGIEIIPAAGGRARGVSPYTNFEDDFPIWSQDSRHIYFTSRRSGTRNLWKMKADGKNAVQITKNGAVFGTPTPDEKFVFFKKEGAEKEMWRAPVDGNGAEKLLSEFTQAGFSGSWIMKELGIYFLARDADQNYRLKFYDFADQKIKDAPGKYNIPPEVDASCTTTDGKVLLCSVFEKSSRLMLADLQ